MSQQGSAPRQGLDHRNPVAKLIGKVGFCARSSLVVLSFSWQGLLPEALQLSLHTSTLPEDGVRLS